MEHQIAELLTRLGLTLAVAESATGGRVADRITNVSGSSAYFIGGVIAYDNRIKTGLLAVREDTIKTHGAVSEETAREMAQGARRRFAVDIAVSTTGIAGPTGATPTKPVGLLYVGVASSRGVRAQRFLFQADREANKEAFTDAALGFLKEELEQWSAERS